MQKQNFLKCIICGKSYRGYRTCRGRAEYSPWRNVCDTPQHYQVYRVIQDLDAEILSKSEAKKMLENIGITSVEYDDLQHSGVDGIIHLPLLTFLTDEHAIH